MSPRSLYMQATTLIAVAVGEPFYDTDGQIYYLCLMVLLEPLQNTTWVLRRQLTLITMVSIGIATLLVSWLSRYITEPVLEITRAADRIAGGDYDTRVRHKGEDEIGVLADTMNNMARKLSQTHGPTQHLVFSQTLFILRAGGNVASVGAGYLVVNLNRFLVLALAAIFRR